MDLVALLRDVPLFSQLSPRQLSGLLETAVVRRHLRGAQLFGAGEDADCFFLVAEGALKVYLLSPDGREHILHVAGPGDLVAEAAVFAQGTYPASAMAIEDSVVVHFYRDRLLALLRAEPELALALLAGLSGRLREFVATIEDLSLRDVTARLARYLLHNSRGGFCKLPGTKTQLAAQLGTVLEPLSRSFRRLKDQGLIQEHKGGIALLDEDGLRALVDGL
jgi:CRP/FNR family transcriptional regulator